MEPAKKDITIRQGGTWSRVFQFKTIADYPLTGCELRAQIRTKDLQTVIHEMDNDTIGGITVDIPNGKFTFLIAATDTAAFTPQMAKWDFEVEKADGTVDPFLYGDCAIVEEVTK